MRSTALRSGARLLALALPLHLAACAAKPDIPEIRYDNLAFDTAVRQQEPGKPVRLVELPKPLPLPGQLKPPPGGGRAKEKKGDLPPEQLVTEANKIAKFEPTQDGYVNAIQNYPFVEGALYQLYAAVNQVSDIALEPGEELISVSSGDTVRWVVGDTRSGARTTKGGRQEQVHVLVKPIAPDLQTNLVIATDRRTYHLEMHSTDATYMASVSWTYPYSDLLALKQMNTKATATTRNTISSGLNLDRIRFRYRIEGKAPWKPVRAFDDGQKVYIQFPSGPRQGEAPPLFVIAADGQLALVNYRVRDNYYIVDRLFAVAELRLGKKPQRIVRIVRTDTKRRAAPDKRELFHDR
ncbi:P-type conjugative transfer protein TrbG [Nitratireductor sp. XY-223]|uniref:P-type conjugative transfer protein TrbG n=1 Tax=Nitratireductor sp. XY-223 TaxID=2561926 RepID=UPI0010AA4939|nr:P-type conjugative transfer protein TrbG [Nitratireductor sp. XY-223]